MYKRHADKVSRVKIINCRYSPHHFLQVSSRCESFPSFDGENLCGSSPSTGSLNNCRLYTLVIFSCRGNFNGNSRNFPFIPWPRWQPVSLHPVRSSVSLSWTAGKKSFRTVAVLIRKQRRVSGESFPLGYAPEIPAGRKVS